MHRIIPLLTLALALPAVAAVKTGDAAPAFKLTDTKGKAHALADFKGKVVVLEWFNKDCPFVKKHYGENHMQQLQKKWTDKGVVWLQVSTGAKGKQGVMTPDEANKHIASTKMASTAYLFDPDGKVGKAYGAKTTPHMYIIATDGKLVYQGGIDDNNSSDAKDVPKARNHVDKALEEVTAGKPVSVATTEPYGCGVKY